MCPLEGGDEHPYLSYEGGGGHANPTYLESEAGITCLLSKWWWATAAATEQQQREPQPERTRTSIQTSC